MKLCINDFEGPLDLLLHLVKTAKMDIYEITRLPPNHIQTKLHIT